MPERYFRTFAGLHVHVFDPRAEEICIEDIAHSLSQICRFVGHTTVFYSVAQHSVLVSQHVPAEDALWGLLHDAPEAYLCDMPAPIKHDPSMEGYRLAEDRLMAAVCERYGLPPQMPQSVKIADRLLLATEFRDVTTVDDLGWITQVCGVAPPPGFRVESCWAPAFAEKRFLARFEELTT